MNRTVANSVAVALILLVTIPAAWAQGVDTGNPQGIIPLGGGRVTVYQNATFTNTDPTRPLFLTAAGNVTFQGDSGLADLNDFTLATLIAAQGGAGLPILPGQTLFFTGQNGNPALMDVSDDGLDPGRYVSGLHYTAFYDLTYHFSGGDNVTLTRIPVEFIYAADAAPEPASGVLFGGLLAIGLLRRRRRAA